jgi:hypothetical protein
MSQTSVAVAVPGDAHGGQRGAVVREGPHGAHPLHPLPAGRGLRACLRLVHAVCPKASLCPPIGWRHVCNPWKGAPPDRPCPVWFWTMKALTMDPFRPNKQSEAVMLEGCAPDPQIPSACTTWIVGQSSARRWWAARRPSRSGGRCTGPRLGPARSVSLPDPPGPEQKKAMTFSCIAPFSDVFGLNEWPFWLMPL